VFSLLYVHSRSDDSQSHVVVVVPSSPSSCPHSLPSSSFLCPRSSSFLTGSDTHALHGSGGPFFFRYRCGHLRGGLSFLLRHCLRHPLAPLLDIIPCHVGPSLGLSTTASLCHLLTRLVPSSATTLDRTAPVFWDVPLSQEAPHKAELKY
jgi:hypothetical protein